MTTTMSALVAGEHIADLRRAAERYEPRPEASSLTDGHGRRVELQLAGGEQADVARRLAALDDAGELEGPVLVALLDGEAVAAISLRDRRVVADPFVLTGEVVALLRLRAEHLSGAPAWRWRLPRLRLA